MPTKILVSYDGTDNDVDALALGRVFGQAGGELGLAYVRRDRRSAARDRAAGSRTLADGNAVDRRVVGRRQARRSPVQQVTAILAQEQDSQSSKASAPNAR